MQQTLTGLLDDLIGAWNRRDVSAFAELFTADADYVTGAGSWLRGRQAIADLLSTADSPPRVRVEGMASVRELGSASSLIFRWVTEDGVEPRRRGVMTCLLVQGGAGWQISRLQNTDEG